MLVINEEYVNATTETRYGASGWQEPYTDDIGTLYRAMVHEFGRCTGHVYVSTESDEAVPVGWVFVRREEYDDYRSGLRAVRGERTYLREVWVTVGERDQAGGVWHYNVKTRKGTMPPQPDDDDSAAGDL